jgi:hypothetical protein
MTDFYIVRNSTCLEDLIVSLKSLINTLKNRDAITDNGDYYEGGNNNISLTYGRRHWKFVLVVRQSLCFVPDSNQRPRFHADGRQ